MIPTSEDADRWAHLTLDQLRGAEYALRVIHTSPTIKGRGLDVVKEQHAVVVELANRKLKVQTTGDNR